MKSARNRNPIVVGILAIVAALSVSAVPASASSSTAVPANTEVALVLAQDLRSGQQKVGDEVLYKTISNVTAQNGQVIIPAGATAHGTVTKSQGCGGFGKTGKLEITCDYLDAPNGARIPFADPDLKKHGSGSQLATILFTPIILLPFSKGKDVTLHEGMVLTMETESDAKIAAARSDSNPQPVLDVLERGKHKKPFHASVKSVAPDAITFATDSGDKVLKLKDIDKVTFGNAQAASN